MTKKDIIENNFSKHAHTYDSYSNVQDECALELTAIAKEKNYTRILDIGCGTGNYTGLLREAFPGAEITAIDVSGKMIEIARSKLSGKNIEFILCDAESADLRNEFDLITSNAGFQWLDNLERAFATYALKMKKSATLLFSIFGPETFVELGESLKLLFGKETSISSSFFSCKKEVEAILKRHFNEVCVEKKVYKKEHDSLSDLLKKIKYSGTRGSGVRTERTWSLGMLSELERIYKGWFYAGAGDKIIATYEVFFCRGLV